MITKVLDHVLACGSFPCPLRVRGRLHVLRVDVQSGQHLFEGHSAFVIVAASNVEGVVAGDDCGRGAWSSSAQDVPIILDALGDVFQFMCGLAMRWHVDARHDVVISLSHGRDRQGVLHAYVLDLLHAGELGGADTGVPKKEQGRTHNAWRRADGAQSCDMYTLPHTANMQKPYRRT